MARRKRTDAKNAALGGVALFFILCLLGAFNGHTGAVIALAIAVPTVYFAVTYFDGQERFKKARLLIDPHAQELAIRRKQLLGAGSYGIVDSKPWSKEINRFIDNVLAPQLGDIAAMRPRIHMMVDYVATSVALSNSFYPGMPPSDYEHFVASELRRFEWAAKVSGKAGDQGVDVLATKGRLRLVVQCKLYSKPVGNAAVQEAIAGRGWETATHAIVVSNAAFTKSAQQLAATQGILLLHHDQLSGLEARLIPDTAGLH